MDINPLDIVRKVWRHAGVNGNVWTPTIANIGKKNERFREGPKRSAAKPGALAIDPDVDSYWTPAVSHGDTRRVRKTETASNYPAQRVVWVDCDESYNRTLLEFLKPSFMWETSPGHTQAVWLLKDTLPLSEFHRDGFVGMLIQAVGADKSGVDVSQLLRVPGSWHHKGKAFEGRVLAASGRLWTRGMLLGRVARGLGFSPGLASELAAEHTFGDRSKVLWRFARNAAELNIDEQLTFKLLKATDWNKWKDDPDRLKADIASAYAQQPKDPEKTQAQEELHQQEDEVVEAWTMADVASFGPVMRKPVTWILPGIIPEGGCGLLVAPPKTGKSRIATEMVLGLATGRRPLGLSVRRQQAVGFFSLEDGEHLVAERMSYSLNSKRGRQPYHWDGHITRVEDKLRWEPPRSMPLFTHFAPINLHEGNDMQRLLETIQKYELKLVILDTLSLAIGKANVSDQKEMYTILTPLKLIAQGTGCAVMFIHHTRKRVFEKGETVQESILGATALHGWSDFILSLAPPAEEGDMLRLGVQTKRGGAQHYINDELELVKRPALED